MNKKGSAPQTFKPSQNPFPLVEQKTEYVIATESDRRFMNENKPLFPTILDETEIVGCNQSDLLTQSQLGKYFEKRQAYPKKTILDMQLLNHQKQIEEVLRECNIKSAEELKFKSGEINKQKQIELGKRNKIFQTLRGKMSVNEAAEKAIRPALRSKFKDSIHSIMKTLSNQRVDNKMTEQNKEILMLFAQYGISENFLKQSASVLQNEMSHLNQNEKKEFLERRSYICHKFIGINENMDITAIEKKEEVEKQQDNQFGSILDGKLDSDEFDSCESDKSEKAKNMKKDKTDPMKKYIEELNTVLENAGIDDQKQKDKYFDCLKKGDKQSLKKLIKDQFIEDEVQLYGPQIDQIIMKKEKQEIKQKQKLKNQSISVAKTVREKLIEQLKQAEIDDEEEVTQCLNLFEQGTKQSINDLKDYPNDDYKQSFSAKIDELIKLKQSEKSVSVEINKKEQQKSTIDIAKQMESICKEVKIKPEKIQQCTNLFISYVNNSKNTQKYHAILNQVTKGKRNKLSQLLNNLLKKIDPNLDIELKKDNEKTEQSHTQILEKSNKSEEIIKQQKSDSIKLDKKQSNSRSFSREQSRSFIQSNLDDSCTTTLTNIDQKTLQDMMIAAGIPQKYHESYEKQIKQGQVQCVLIIPRNKRKQLAKFIMKKIQPNITSIEMKLRMKLTNYMNDQDVQKLIEQLKQGKQQDDDSEQEQKINKKIKKVISQFQTTITIRYSGNKKKRLQLNQFYLTANKRNLITKIEQFIPQIENSYVFIDDERIDLEKYEFNQKSYLLIICELVEYDFKYCGKVSKVNLLPEKSLNFNKTILLDKLVNNKCFIYRELYPFNWDYLTISFQNDKEQQIKQQNSDRTLAEIFKENKNKIAAIIINIMLKVTIFYEDIKDDKKLSSNSKLCNLQKIINDNHVPYESQILHLLNEQGRKLNIDLQKHNQQTIGLISPEWNIVFQLTNRCSYQYYGFHRNYALSFQSFSQFFVEDDELTRKLVQGCSFSKRKDDQAKFIDRFFSYVFSSIKKYFPMKNIISKFQKIVSIEKNQKLWSSSSENQGNKINQNFLLAYMLYNADENLKIQLMNLLKEIMPLPLYCKQFEDISKVPEDKINLNNELLWILKDGFTITSIGFHNINNAKPQTGKSTLLNEIFPIEFEKSKNKHPIIKAIPFIALNVLKDIYPIHVIDISHDCPEKIKKSILKSSNMILIHSWLDNIETENNLKQIKQEYNLPVICLLRDQKIANMLNSLDSNNIIEEKPQVILNICDKQRYKEQIVKLKQKIYEFINIKIKQQKSIQKLFSLFNQKSVYVKFSKTIATIQNKMFKKLTPICDRMNKIKQLEKNTNSSQQISLIKSEFTQNISPEIVSIAQFFLKRQFSQKKYIMMKLLRQKIKTYYNQITMNHVKIYELRDIFEKDIQGKPESQEKVQCISKLNKKLNDLVDLQPVSIEGKDDSTIKEIIQKMADYYETKIKPGIFSIQFFWRQLNYLASANQKYLINNLPIFSVLKQLKEVEVQSNLPFEIIDGDLLQMQRKLMAQLFQNRQDRAVVITILGPQNTGKSTLLNFMFGCDFSTSQGRCTKGVLGTYFKFAENRGYFKNMSHCQGIFVIDTEGLFSSVDFDKQKAEDRKDFDSKLALFCLAVSDFVILNVAQSVDTKIAHIIKICNQKLDKLNLSENKRAETIIVLNFKATDSKQDSQAQLKEIKQMIKFETSVALSFAFNPKTFTSEDIPLLSQNQKLIKRQPRQQFIIQTSSLMKQLLNKIMNKKSYLKLRDLMEKFERIWSLVISFPNLANPVTNEYCQLETKIKKWRKQIDQQYSFKINAIVQTYIKNIVSQDKAFENLKTQNSNLLQNYDKKFREIDYHDIELKHLIKLQKSQLNALTQVQMIYLRCQIETTKIKRLINRSKVQGDFVLKEKARQIINTNQQFTQQQLKKIFNEEFNEQLLKIRQTISLSTQQKDRYLHLIKENMELLIKQQIKNNFALPSISNFTFNVEQDVQQLVKKIKITLIEPNQKQYQDVFVHTNLIYTDILKGGNTDAKLQYFNMKQYFKKESFVQYYGLDKDKIWSILKKDVLRQIYASKVIAISQRHNQNGKLKQIWENINNSLKTVNLKFTNFEQFKKLYCANEDKYLRKIGQYSQNKKEISYQFLNKVQEQSYYQDDISMQQSFSQLNNRNIYSPPEVDHSKHKLCSFLYQYVQLYSDKRCICSYTRKEPETYLLPRFYKHINWDAIFKSINDDPKYKKKLANINQQMTIKLNEDLKQLNLRVNSTIQWRQILNNSLQLENANIHFDLMDKNAMKIQSFDHICQRALHTQFVDPRQFRRILSKFEGNKAKLPIFSVDDEKYEPIGEDNFFNTYLSNNTALTLHELKKPEFKRFIFNEIKNNKNSLSKFFYNIFSIVKSIISQQIFQRKTYQEVFTKVKHEICKFNDDLNQISCNLSDKYLGYIFLAVIYMMWKFVIDEKLKEKEEIYIAKQNQYDRQWEQFKIRTSRQEQKNVEEDIKQFIKYFVDSMILQVKDIKKVYMQQGNKRFEKESTRKQIQQWVDMSVSKYATVQQTLEYLQNPIKRVKQRYQVCYENSWNQLKQHYSVKNDCINNIKNMGHLLQEMISKLNQIFDKNKIEPDKGTFSDMFTIANKEQTQQTQVTQKQYNQTGKRVLFQYFIDTLLCEEPNKPRKCSIIDVKPNDDLGFKQKQYEMQQTHKTLKQKLNELRSVKKLTMTNMVKFAKKFSQQKFKSLLFSKINELVELSEKKDKQEYLQLIKVLVCQELCPCCRRICGLINGHSHHMCVYGHQMRALNGSFFKRPNGKKEASVIRCEDILETSQILYNGHQYSWKKFKDYWKDKKTGGWDFSDLQQTRKKQIQFKFKTAWNKVGELYCKQHQLQYVPYDRNEQQKHEDTSTPIHYIFAVDISGSMTDPLPASLTDSSAQISRFTHLHHSLKETLEKIKEKDRNRNKARVSLMAFNHSIHLLKQNALPQDITVQLPEPSGGTNFQEVFQQAAKIASRYIQIQDTTVLFIFMTDGDCSYPSQGIKVLKQLQAQNPGRLRYSGIELASKVEMLKTIAHELKGSSGIAYNAEQLTDLFLESIEVIEYREPNQR